MIREHPIRGEGQRGLLGEWSLPTPQDSFLDAGEAINDFWSMSGTSKTAITWNQESNITRREKNHSLFHCNTLTSPQLRIRTWMLYKKAGRIDDYWNIDGSRDLSDSWTGFTQFTLFSETPPEGFLWSGERLTKRQATSRPDHLWPELGRGMARNARLRQKHKWAIEKPKLDNARRLRGIYFIDLRTRSSRKPLEMQEKLETPMAPAVPCKTCKKSKHGEIRNKTYDFKSLFACILEASESTRLRVEESVPTYHEDHIAGRGDNSLQHYNLEHKIYSYASSNEDTRSKSSSG